MDGGQLIREARRRAGLTQAELAARLGTSQPAVARWESGRVSPTVDTLARAVRTCGFEVVARLVPVDEYDWTLVEQNLRRTPEQRFDKAVRAARFVGSGRRAVAGARRG